MTDRLAITPALIRRTVAHIAEQHNISLADLESPARRKPLVDARMDAAVTLRDMGVTLPRIGEALGGRDHTTIINLLERAKRNG